MGSSIMPIDRIKGLPSQALGNRLLGSVGDHLPSLGSLPSPGHLEGQSSSMTTSESLAFGLENQPKLTSLPFKDIGEIPLSHGDLGLGDIRPTGSLVMVLAGTSSIRRHLERHLREASPQRGRSCLKRSKLTTLGHSSEQK